MKLKSLFLALLFSASLVPAHAVDTLTITIVSDSPVQTGTLTKTWTLAQSDMTSFLTWVVAAYPCTPVSPATTCAVSVPNSVLGWAQGIVNGTVANVQNAAASAAATNAAAGVAAIKPQ